MKAIITIAMVILVVSSGCVNTKYIYKNNTIYDIETPPEDLSGTINPHKLNAGLEATIVDKGDYLEIVPLHKVALPVQNPRPLPAKEITGRRAELQLSKKYYFSEEKSLPVVNTLTYFDSKPVLQTLTIPIKYRRKLTDVALRDSFPSVVETGVNINIAFGWKFNHNVYSSNKNIFGQNTNKFSFSAGALLGFGGTDLSKANTRGPVITYPRKAFTTTVGGFAMLGFNSINVGYAFGWDSPSGLGSKEWLYRGKMWHGIAVGFDLIK